MKFSQFLNLSQGKNKFKQAPNVILVQSDNCNNSDNSNNGDNSDDSSNLWSPARNPIEQGTISALTGGDGITTTKLRTAGYIKVQPNTTYEFDSNIARVYVIEFREQGEYPIEYSGWENVPFTYTTTETTEYIRMILENASGSTITVDDFEWLKITQQ